MSETKRNPDRLDNMLRAVKVVSIVAGVVITVLSFNETRQKDARARQTEADNRKFELQKYYDDKQEQSKREQVEAAKPFLDLRQKLYLEAIQNAGIIVNPNEHTDMEMKKAMKRFWELYWAELCLVESKEVESAMIRLGETITDTNTPIIGRQRAAVKLAHMLRDSLIKSWGIEDNTKVGEVNR